MHLKNDTGESFREAIYLDFNANQQRIIPAMRPGDEIDLTNLPTKAIWNKEIGSVAFRGRRIPLDKDEKPDRPFSIAELPYIGFDRGLTTAQPNRFFGGLCAQPRTGAKLDVPWTKYSAWNLVWVSLDEP
jgi:hypothetical protein